MPLLPGGEDGPELATASHARARKVRPQYARGELVKVAWARNQAEAELIAGLLLEEGIPSIERRTRGFDVPDFLAAGPRDLLVAESGVEQARRLLGAAELEVTTPGAAGPTPQAHSPVPLRLVAGVLVVAMLGTGLAALIFSLAG